MEELKKKLLGIEPASLVELKFSTENGFEKIYSGHYKLFRNNKEEWTDSDYVRLTDIIEITGNERRKGIRPIFVSIPDILSVEVVTEDTSSLDSRPKKEEETIVESPTLVLPTIVVNKRESFDKIMNSFNDIEVIACSLEGTEKVDRFGVVNWINLVVDSTIVALQIEPLAMDMGDDKKLWERLDLFIFGNRQLVKVMHDCRMAADFLYHQHGIRVENVFDTMIADIYLQKTTQDKIPRQFSSLSQCLQLYCQANCSPRELQVLQEYENNPKLSTYWVNEPRPEIRKIGAIKIKYLIFLRQVLLEKIMSKYTSVMESHINSLLKSV